MHVYINVAIMNKKIPHKYLLLNNIPVKISVKKEKNTHHQFSNPLNFFCF